ncbi:MAG: HEAT repeat domain-containing protein [Dehalococcoidia bacterium]
MGVTEFLEQLPENNDAPLSFAAIAELSSITAEEADELARSWDEWPGERVRELLERLAGMAQDDTRLEFETVFKAALTLPDPYVRRLAVTGLEESADRTLSATFADMVQADPDEDVRARTAQTMSTLCALAVEGWLHSRDADRLFESLFNVLQKPDEAHVVKCRALESVAVFGGDRVSGFIQWAFDEGDLTLRQSALIAMGRTCDPRWMSAILEDLDHVNAGVRFEATRALGEVGGEDAAPHLAGPLDDQDLDVQIATVAALERLGGDDAKRQLKQATRGPEPAVAEAAKQALQTLENEEKLYDPITPEMRKGGGLFGGPIPGAASDDEDDDYDAASREGWEGVEPPDGMPEIEDEENTQW